MTALTRNAPTAPAPKRVCANPWQQMVIDLTGEAVPCCYWSGYSNGGRPLGNTNSQTIEEIWNGPGYQELRRRIVDENDKDFPCHSCMVATWRDGRYPTFAWPSFFGAEAGHCYSGPVLRSALDRMLVLDDEPWTLLEDGVAIGHAGAALDDIRRLGAGRFVVADTHLYMSTSDNSSPLTNGRRYELVRGDVRWDVKTTDVNSVSGANLQRAYEEYQAEATVLTAKPSQITFVSTSDCNIDCGMCSQNKVRKHKVQHRPETQQDLMALTPYLVQLNWHGGEPFLIDDFRTFYNEFETAANPNLTFGFTSNGTMISEKVLTKLLKFPRLSASISIDSFNAASFERIRSGARFDVVMANLHRAMRHHDFPDRMFSIGALVMKSNLRELPENIRYVYAHDLVAFFGPLVVYPAHERLDVFQDFGRETAGWDEAITEARCVAREGIVAGRASGHNRRAHDLGGMVDAIAQVVEQARRRYANAAMLTVHVADPTGSLAHMRLPGFMFFSRGPSGRALGYVVTREPGTYTVQLPATELNLEDRPYGHFYHDLHDETDCLRTLIIKGDSAHGGLAEMRVEVPAFAPPVFVRNLRLSNGGRAKPDGLIVLDPARDLP